MNQKRTNWWVGWSDGQTSGWHGDVFLAPTDVWKPKVDGSWGSYETVTGPYRSELEARNAADAAFLTLKRAHENAYARWLLSERTRADYRRVVRTRKAWYASHTKEGLVAPIEIA